MSYSVNQKQKINTLKNKVKKMQKAIVIMEQYQKDCEYLASKIEKMNVFFNEINLIKSSNNKELEFDIYSFSLYTEENSIENFKEFSHYYKKIFLNIFSQDAILLEKNYNENMKSVMYIVLSNQLNGIILIGLNGNSKNSEPYFTITIKSQEEISAFLRNKEEIDSIYEKMKLDTSVNNSENPPKKIKL